MAISHADHDHPNTPAARAKCRREMDNTHTPYVNPMRELVTGTTHETMENVEGDRKPVKMTVVPRKRGDGGVVKGMQAAKPTKRSGTRIRTIGDLPDVPRMLAYCAKLAWAEGWEVRVGEPFNDNEAHLVITGPVAEITAIWRVNLPNGIWALHMRKLGSSKGSGKASSALEAIEMAAGRSPLP
jgi:hypothetical protein